MVKLYRPFLGSLDTLSSDFLKFLSCFKGRKKEARRGSTSLPQKKINGFARFTKVGLSASGGGLLPPFPRLAPPLLVVNSSKWEWQSVAKNNRRGRRGPDNVLLKKKSATSLFLFLNDVSPRDSTLSLF